MPTMLYFKVKYLVLKNLVCYSVVVPSSLENVREKWVPEVTHYCPGTPFLLVGTQTDLREDTDTVQTLAKNERRKPVQKEAGERMAKVGKYATITVRLCHRGLTKKFSTLFSPNLEGS